MKNIVVVGFGGMGSWHVSHLLKSDVMCLKGIYDIKPERREAAYKQGLAIYSTLEDVLKDKQIDLITIATPNDSHKEIAIKAMRAGKNVISEKPVTLSSKDLAEMVAVSKETGKLFTVHQNRRWDPDYLAVRKVIESGRLGDIVEIQSRVHGSHGIPGDWRGKPEHGGGMVLDCGVHLIDQINQMNLGEKKYASAHLDFITNKQVDDGFNAVITYKNGLRATVEVGTSNYINMPRWYVKGTKGTLLMQGFDGEGKYVCWYKPTEKEVVPVQLGVGASKTMAPRDAETVQTFDIPKVKSDVHDFYRNVANAIDGKESQLITHEQLRQVMCLMEAILFSGVNHGEVVEISHTNDEIAKVSRKSNIPNLGNQNTRS